LESEFIWTKSNGVIIPNVTQYIKDYINSFEWIYEIWIGTDAQKMRRRNTVLFSSVICIYKQGMGGHIIHSKHKRTDIKNKYDKLKKEVEYSLKIAEYLNENGVLILPEVFTVHIDVSPNVGDDSNKIYNEMIGWVKGMGYNCEAKPGAPAASHAADHIVKDKNIPFYEFNEN